MRRILLLNFVLIFAACSDKTTTGNDDSSGCNGNATCESGEVCLATGCAQICDTDQGCESNEICGPNAVCIVGVRADAPEITAVNGDGSVLAPTTTESGVMATNRLRNDLIITGRHLAGATVSLIGTSIDTNLDVVEFSDDRLVAALPASLIAGAYALTVTNAAGSAQTTTYILQGETGADGSNGVAGQAGSAGATGPRGLQGPGELVVEFDFEELSGLDFVNSAIPGNDGTAPVSGIAVGSTGRTTGSRSIGFSGGVVVIASGNEITDSANIAVEAWIEPALPLNASRVILQKEGVYTLSQENDAIAFTVTTGDGDCSVTTSDVVVGGNWAHVSGWYNGLVVAVAIDGGTFTAPCANGRLVAGAGSLIQVGGVWDEATTITQPYSGKIDEVRVRQTAPRYDSHGGRVVAAYFASTPATRQTIGSITPTKVTGLELSITPTSVDSQFLIMAVVNGAMRYVSSSLVYRNGSKVLSHGGNTNEAGAQATTYFGPDASGNMYQQTIHHLDSPSTTSAVTYDIRFTSGWGGAVHTTYINDRDSNDMRTPSTLMILELAPN